MTGVRGSGGRGGIGGIADRGVAALRKIPGRLGDEVLGLLFKGLDQADGLLKFPLLGDRTMGWPPECDCERRRRACHDPDALRNRVGGVGLARKRREVGVPCSYVGRRGVTSPSPSWEFRGERGVIGDVLCGPQGPNVLDGDAKAAAGEL